MFMIILDLLTYNCLENIAKPIYEVWNFFTQI